MAIWRDGAEVPGDLTGSVVVIGNFDGVHLGHRAVIEEARAGAERLELPLVAVTFDPHPMAVLRPEHAPTMLTSIEARAELLADAGVDHLFAQAFDREVASWSPEEFIERVLVQGLRAHLVVVGANFRFGHRASGDVATLRRVGESSGFTAVGVELDGGPQVWSSTYVRTCLAAGDVAGAAEALGRPFSLRGVVTQGDQRGRELGYPTANVPVDAAYAAPADGVYAGWLRPIDSPEQLPAAISVGTNPTFEGERDRRVESYVLDRTDLDLYGVEVEVTFVEQLRGMVAFDGIEPLLEQMADDVRRTRVVLAQPADGA
ncbi:bifunctional riboflavin kinase/FAD synthetase [Nocardioides salsibiostraticola]